MIKIELNELTGDIEIEEKYKDREYRVANFATMIRSYYESVKKEDAEFAEYFKEKITQLFKEDLIFASDDKLREEYKKHLKSLLDDLIEDLGINLSKKLEKTKKETKTTKIKKSKKD